MGLFDRYIAVDWSAANTPKRGPDSIWCCAAGSDDAAATTLNLPTRHAAEAWLTDQLLAAAGAAQRTLVGVDFPYGYPAGFAAALGVEDWRGIWGYLERQISDDARNRSNRFEVAEAINRALGPRAPFWGRPAARELPALPVRKQVVYRSDGAPGALPEWREVERALQTVGRHPQTAFKLAGAGAVGSQSLVGIPVLQRLRTHAQLSDVTRVWPFELGTPMGIDAAMIVHAEIWPSLSQFASEPGSCRDERQVRAVVREWRALDAAQRLAARFAVAPVTPAVTHEEGWVLGAAPARPARTAPRLPRDQ